MALEIISLSSGKFSANNYDAVGELINPFLNGLKDVWSFTNSSIEEIDESTYKYLVGKYYFKDENYIEISFNKKNTREIIISYTSPAGTAKHLTEYKPSSASDGQFQASVVKGESGFGLGINFYSTSTILPLYCTNISTFFGKCIALNGEEIYGATLLQSGSYRNIIDEQGLYDQPNYSINYDTTAGYKCIMYQLSNPVSGAVFKNIYAPYFCEFTQTKFQLGDKMFFAGEKKTCCVSEE